MIFIFDRDCYKRYFETYKCAIAQNITSDDKQYKH